MWKPRSRPCWGSRASANGWRRNIAMRALAWPDAFIPTDHGLRKALPGLSVAGIKACAEAWRPWRAYAVMAPVDLPGEGSIPCSCHALKTLEASMNQVFAPGCGLRSTSPNLRTKCSRLARISAVAAQHLTCCHHAPGLPRNGGHQCVPRLRSSIPGAVRRRFDAFPMEVLAESRAFPFPDYGGKAMAIHDACPTRDQDRVHDAVRTLLARMNITS